jgi:hypothetical protein
MTNRDRLTALGEALHGPRWQRQTAHDLDVDPRQVQRWTSGEYDVPDGVIADLERVARDRVKIINAALSAKQR